MVTTDAGNRDRANAQVLEFCLAAVLAAAIFLLGSIESAAQSATQLALRPPAPAKTNEPTQVSPPPPALEEGGREDAKTPKDSPRTSSDAESPATTQPQFRVERMPIAGGAELFTIFARLDGMRAAGQPAPEIPLLSVVRDSLGDDNPENDRLRYLWMLTYTRPTLVKRVLSAVPFLYQHVGNKTATSSNAPAPLIDLANTKRQTWNNLFWFGLQNVLFDSYGIPLKAASRNYRRKATDYRAAHVTQALSILNSYGNLRRRARDESELLASSQVSNSSESSAPNGVSVSDVKTPLLADFSPVFTAGEMLEMRARLILSSKLVGGLYGPNTFDNTVIKRSMATTDSIGHNWEMLRQRAETEGLYFQPLTMPDGTATHALLWIAKSDLSQTDRRFGDRFLNISDPWKDQRLRNWTGYSQVRYFDQDNRPTNAGDPQARTIELIPLALYGLDHKKIPALLIDFRDTLNPKKRELSRRFFRDFAKNVFKGVYPFTPLVTTTTQQSYYLKGQSTDYPTALLDFDGNERAGLHLRNSDLNVLHLMLQQLKRQDLSPQLNQALKDAFFATVDRARRRWQGDLDQLGDELGALHKDIRTQRELWAREPQNFTAAEKEMGKDDQVRRVYARILQLEEFERRYQNDYLAPMRKLLSMSPKNFDPSAPIIEEVIPNNAMGPRNSIRDLQNYVVGLGRDGLVLKSDGSLDADRSFVRLNYFDLLQRQTVRKNVQPGVSNHPIDFIATRIPRESIATVLSAELEPDDDVVWLYGGADRQALILARAEASGQLQLRYLPIANLIQDAQGLIRFDVTEWRSDLPLRILEDPRLDAPGTDRVAWLSDWHTDVEWLHALHKTQYSNGLIGLHEQFTMFPAPGIDASERGLSRDEQLLRQFCRRRREAVETDLLIEANNHWNFDVRGFNPGGNHGSFFRISTHSTLMFAGGAGTGIPRGLAVTEPYDSLSVVPTILALTGNLQSDNQPVEKLVKRGFLKFPGRVISEVANSVR